MDYILDDFTSKMTEAVYKKNGSSDKLGNYSIMNKDIYDFSDDPNPKAEHGYMMLAGICIILGLIFTVLLFIHQPFSNELTQSSNTASQSYFALNGTIGDFISGTVGTLFSLAGFVLIYLSFKSQQEALKVQKDNFESEKIESRFFELINLHRSNIDEMVFRDWKTGEEVAKGRPVFKEIYSQLRHAIIYTTSILKTVSVNRIIKKDSFVDLYTKDDVIKKELAISNLAYSLVFFGLAEESFEGLLNALSKDFNEGFIKSYASFLQLVPVKKSKFRDDWDFFFEDPIFDRSVKQHFLDNKPLTIQSMYSDSKPEYFKYFGGHQSKLGHYYRHLFRTISYIDSKEMKFKIKEEYVRVLRAQLSNYEEFLLFFNSICFVGREWELNHKDNIHKMLISKYDMIRNIPYTIYKYNVKGVQHSINLKNFYPLVAFEFEDIPAGTNEFINAIELVDPKY